MSIADQIMKLQSLKESGAITEEEFAAQKSEVLKSSGEYHGAIGGGKIDSQHSHALKVVVVYMIFASAIPFLTAFLIGRVEPFGGILYLAFGAIFGSLYYYAIPFLLSVAGLFGLYFMIRFEDRFPMSERSSVFVTIVAFSVLGAILPALVGVSYNSFDGLLLTLILLLIVRASLGSFSRKKI